MIQESMSLKYEPASNPMSLKLSDTRGELMHMFVSYRVETEGDAEKGNMISRLLAQKVRASSSSLLSLQVLEGP